MAKGIRKPKDIIALMNRADLLGPVFAGPSWGAWRVFLKALYGLYHLTNEDWELYQKCTGREAGDIDMHGYTEAYLCVGRRGGKSFIIALICVWTACFRDWTKHLAPGEVATVMVIAVDRDQARTIMRYVKGLLSSVPALSKLVENERRSAIDLKGNVCIEVHTASYRAVRSYTIVLCIAEELAFWRTDDNSVNPDSEILQAIRPAMGTTPGSMLIGISSPYSRRGELWRAFGEFHGKPDAPVLFWKADTRTMNPSFDQKIIDRAMERDPDAALAEYGAEFRSDLADFVSREAVQACVSRDVLERPYVAGVSYRAFVDPSGGASDSFTLAIGHAEGEKRIVDATREVRPKFSPDNVCAEFATLLKSYKLSTIVGDRYAGEWPRERFRVHGIMYETSEMTKSDIYINALPLFNAGRVDLLDLPRLINQLCALERRTSRQGKDSVDHPPGAHDDVANVVAGVLCLCDKPVIRHRVIVPRRWASPGDYFPNG